MSLSSFKRDSNKVMRHMKKTKEAVVLTVNGKAAVVIQDAESYQKLLGDCGDPESASGVAKS